MTKRAADKKVGQYKSLNEALTNTQKEIELLAKNNESIKQSTAIAKKELELINTETAELQSLKGQDDSLKLNIQEQHAYLETVQSTLNELNTNIEKGEQDLNELMSDIDLYSRLDEYTALGHFELPQYLSETSTRYAEEIKDIRQQQKDMIKDKTAITFPETTVISNDKSFNKKILNGQVKLMLIAFNIECDVLIGKISPSSFGRTLERIEKLANNLEKSAATFECGFDLDYIALKFEECKLQYQFTLKKQEEIAEQKLIKEQIREVKWSTNSGHGFMFALK
ncbi:DUF4041 domain-containing protein [uncultured Shewanella sp.]|uniref:DUF4041 domain-containing protein n=1 Tax=uncultured Shewanella sp. TaxID=173975 RepID=UPI00260C9E2F|nr:DUF4041 domain-containing protein [uncultured Shewanella sp.]